MSLKAVVDHDSPNISFLNYFVIAMTSYKYNGVVPLCFVNTEGYRIQFTLLFLTCSWEKKNKVHVFPKVISEKMDATD